MDEKEINVWYKFLQNEQLNCENLYHGKDSKLGKTMQRIFWRNS